jgi:hypothetical protein
MVKIKNIIVETYLNINEESFYKLSNDKILTKKYVKNFINREDAIEYILDSYIEENELDEDNENEIRNSEEFYNYVYDYLENSLNDARENIYDKIDYDSDKIKIYRAITVDDNWLNHLKSQGKRLGIYWSWSDDGAETHWGDYNKKNEAIIEAEIDEKYINWIETLEMNLHPNFSEEKEIRLFKNTPIKILSITINNEEINIDNLRNKIFIA